MDNDKIIKELEDIKIRIGKMADSRKKLHKAVCLLSSMVEGGEQHSNTSREIVRDALDS